MNPAFSTLASGAQLPALLVIGALAVVVPLLVHLLIRRRTVLFDWGAMQLLYEAVQRRGRMRLLRLLLLLVRMATPLCAAAALAGVWLSGNGETTRNWSVVLLDDTIGSFVDLPDGGRSIDTHLTSVAALKQQGPLRVVALSGRPLPADLSTLEPVAAGPNWSAALQSGAQLARHAGQTELLLLSDLRTGVLPTEAIMQQAEVSIAFHPPAVEEVHTIRILQVRAPRAVQLPGDPFEHGYLEADLVRDGPLPAQQTHVLLLDDAGDTAVELPVHWREGESSHTAQLALPNITARTAFRVLVKGSSSPAATRWIVLGHQPSAEITVITDTPSSTFDAASDASWIDMAIQAGASNDALRVSQVFPQDLLVEALPAGMPVVVTISNAVPTATWSAVLDREPTGEVLVLPSPDAGGDWLHTMVQAVDPDFEGTLRAVTGDRAAQHTLQLADDLGPLELIRAELPALLGSMQIERMVDLRPLLELGSALVLLNEQPLFVQLHNAPVVVSALAWHPSWSDLPLRPAGPTLIQELLRADLGKHLLETRVAAGPNNLHGGLQGGAVLIQPDAAAAEQTPASTSDIQRLQTAGWSQLLEQASGAAPRDLSGLFVSLLVALIIMESILTRWIDVGVRRTGAQTA